MHCHSFFESETDSMVAVEVEKEEEEVTMILLVLSTLIHTEMLGVFRFPLNHFGHSVEIKKCIYFNQ